MYLHVLCVSLYIVFARLCCLVFCCVVMWGCVLWCVLWCVCVCVLCRDASSALRCMAGEDRTNENAAEGGLLRQRAVRRRTDPSAPVISAWTLRRGNCVCSVRDARCVFLLRALSDACGTRGCSKFKHSEASSGGFCVLPVEVTVRLCCRRRCCCSTSQTPASPIRLEKRHLTSPVNSDALR